MSRQTALRLRIAGFGLGLRRKAYGGSLRVEWEWRRLKVLRALPVPVCYPAGLLRLPERAYGLHERPCECQPLSIWHIESYPRAKTTIESNEIDNKTASPEQGKPRRQRLKYFPGNRVIERATDGLEGSLIFKDFQEFKERDGSEELSRGVIRGIATTVFIVCGSKDPKCEVLDIGSRSGLDVDGVRRTDGDTHRLECGEEGREEGSVGRCRSFETNA